MGNNIKLFHGSGIIVEKPQVLISGFYKDFGYDFSWSKWKKIYFIR